ncbi:MAG: hypothetical protein IJM45_06660 [Clostridia bacterium]|nr:hypothetical protein [Clostridia bacterium]
MNNEKIFDAVSLIDGEMITQAADFSSVNESFRRERANKRRMIALMCCLALVFGCAGVYFGAVRNTPSGPVAPDVPESGAPEAATAAVASVVTTVPAVADADGLQDEDAPETQPVDGLSGAAAAVTVRYEGKLFYICGEGELSVILDCGLPGLPAESDKGELVASLVFSGSSYIPAGEERDTGFALYRYAPAPDNGSVYVFEDHGVLFAAIMNDGERYHGLD